MDLLAGAHTRVYLSHESIHGAVELLTYLLDQWLQGLKEEEPGMVAREMEQPERMLGTCTCVMSAYPLWPRPPVSFLATAPSLVDHSRLRKSY